MYTILRKAEMAKTEKETKVVYNQKVQSANWI